MTTKRLPGSSIWLPMNWCNSRRTNPGWKWLMFFYVEVTDPRHHRLMVCSWFRPIYIYYIFIYIYTYIYIYSYMSMYDTCRWECQPRYGDPDRFKQLRLVIKSHWCQGSQFIPCWHQILMIIQYPCSWKMSATRIIQTQPWIFYQDTLSMSFPADKTPGKSAKGKKKQNYLWNDLGQHLQETIGFTLKYKEFLSHFPPILGTGTPTIASRWESKGAFLS